jgi:hypothetical protein
VTDSKQKIDTPPQFLWYFSCMETTRVAFDLTPAEVALVEKLKANLALTVGKTSTVAVMRWALRMAAKQAA